MKKFLFVLLLSVLCVSCSAHAGAPANAATVELLRTPNGGIQPQAALDAKGVLHLIYFKGEAAAGDIFYVQRKPDEEFSAPMRVNSEAGNAIATGTIRGAQIAIGKDDRVHVAWNGSDRAAKGVGGTPMLYARLNDAGTAFEPQRNLITWAGGLDGGGTLAADDKGDVYVAWHAGEGDESARNVVLARSTNNGKTFARERKINVQPTGACGCCQMRALVDHDGNLYVLYRAAGNGIDRDSTLLVSTDKGGTFKSAMLEAWKIAMCPMSSYALTESKDGVLAAWETADEVRYAKVQSDAKFDTPILMSAKGAAKNRKHPVLMTGANGALLFAWTEGTGWNKGGALAWQLYDADGKAGEKGRADGVPVWGLLTAVARPDGFILIY